MKHIFTTYRYAIIVLSSLLVLSCTLQTNKRHYIIGVSQCSEDSWRTKLKAELEQSTYFHDGIDLRIMSADDDVQMQKQQIHELIAQGIDLLIVSPQQTHSLSDAIKEATEKGVPVIMFDRKSDVKDYTAFMGADNFAIGEMMGEYAASQLGGIGNIIEIAGEHGSSPAMERHRGFNEAISRYPGLKIIGYAEGDWKQNSGDEAMSKILSGMHGTDIAIDCIFGGNDRMALGARSALERYSQSHPGALRRMPSSVIYLGVDALATPGGGIEKVQQGLLTASAIYPTHGNELMDLAVAILQGETFEKNTGMETSIVTSANAKVLLMQYKEIITQDEYIKKMQTRVDSIMKELDTERTLLFFIVLVVVIVCVSLVGTVRTIKIKHRLNEHLKQKNHELELQKETAERQRDELEEQRDKLIEATMHNQQNKEQDDEMLYDDEKADFRQQNEFIQKFNRAVDDNMSNSDLSVEDIGDIMLLSRVQLYRRVKAMTGKSPVEIIRERRLKRANLLLADTSLSVSEIAYRVGFASPSYFTKCYKDFFGHSPKGT